MKNNFDEFNESKQRDSAYYRRKNLGIIKKCNDCGLYGCTCQTTLEEF